MSIESSENGLISLLEKARRNRQKISVVVELEFATIAELRKLSVPWVEIAESLGFAGRFHGVEKAFLRLKRKKKVVVPEIRKEVAKEKDEEQKEPVSAKEKVEAVKRKIPRIDLEKKDRELNLFERMKLY